MLPLWLPDDAAVVRDSEFRVLKQYLVLVDKFELGNVTTFPEIFVAVPIPGHADASLGIFEVDTVQLAVFVLTVKLVGKVILRLFSVPLSLPGVVAHT